VSEAALPLFRQVGDALGEANCIERLGDIALERSDHDGGKVRCKEALRLFRQVGSVQGEAICIQGQGDIALAQSDHAGAKAKHENALALYRRIEQPYSIGCACVRLANLCDDGAERDAYIAEARRAWSGIDRPDLLETLEREFSADSGIGGDGTPPAP